MFTLVKAAAPAREARRDDFAFGQCCKGKMLNNPGCATFSKKDCKGNLIDGKGPCERI